jgi:hypothetical protein
VSMAGRLALLRLSELKLHEQVSEPLVLELMRELERDGLQLDPIIVEGGQLTVLDGAHRVEALKRLGARWVASYIVDYSSEDVQLRSWAWLLSREPRGELGALGLRRLEGQEPDRAYVLVCASGRYAPREPALDALSWAGALWRAHRLLSPLISAFVTPEQAKGAGTCAYLEPLLPGKQGILKLASLGQRLPPKVTRHVIMERPVNIRYPLEELRSESPKGLAERPRFARLPAGSWFRGRFYEEELLVALGDDKGQGARLS